MPKPPKPLNERLADRFRRRQIQVFRFAESINSDVMKRFAGLRIDLVKFVAVADPSGPARVGDQLNRADALASEVRPVIRGAFTEVNRTVQRQLAEFATVEQRVVGQVVTAVTGGDYRVNLLPSRVLNRVVDRAIVDGAPSSEWWRRQGEQLWRTFHDEMRAGINAGESVGQLIQRIRGTRAQNGLDGIFGPLIRRNGSAEALVRSSTMAVQNAVKFEQFKRSEVVRGVQVLTTFDTSTCRICIAYSAGAWNPETGRALRGSPRQGPMPVLPIHWECRCIWVPVLEDEPLPEDISFEQWLRGETVAEQRAILGPGRYELWAKGELSLANLVDQRGRPMRIDELKEAA